MLSQILEIAKNKHIPKKIKKFNKRKHGKEGWMTNELLTKVVKKNKLYVIWKTTPLTNENYEIYKARFKDHDKAVKKDIVNAKKRDYNRIFDTYRSDMKKTWKTINETLSRNKFISELPSTFLHDDLELTDPIEIANAFNTHFASIGKTLASQIENSITSDKDFTQYLNSPSLKSCKFKCVSQAEVMTAIDNLKNKNISRHDGISNEILKFIKFEISNSIALIINQMITTGIFLESFKTLKIVPLFKTGESSLLTNYRPISLLPTISKIFERIIHDQMYTYLNSNNLLNC